jgi:hypothetical protein
LDGSIIDCDFDGTAETFDVNGRRRNLTRGHYRMSLPPKILEEQRMTVGGDGRSRTYLAKKTYQIQGAAASESARVEHSSWHFGGSSADQIPNLSELRCLLGVDDADGRPLRRARKCGGPS